MNEGTRVPISYRAFHDIPRAFVVKVSGQTFLLDCPFDEEIDEYRDHFVVYRLPPHARDQLETMSWESLLSLGREVARVATRDVEFDPSRRRYVNASVFRALVADEHP